MNSEINICISKMHCITKTFNKCYTSHENRPLIQIPANLVRNEFFGFEIVFYTYDIFIVTAIILDEWRAT